MKFTTLTTGDATDRLDERVDERVRNSNNGGGWLEGGPLGCKPIQRFVPENAAYDEAKRLFEVFRATGTAKIVDGALAGHA